MLDKNTLYDLYVTQQKTGKEIADIAGVNSPQTVYNWLQKHGIPRRDIESAQRPLRPTKEQLESLYTVQGMSIDSVAKALGSSESSVSKLLDRYGITKRPKTAKFAGWNKGKPLPEAQKIHLSDLARQRTGKKSHRFGVTLSSRTRRKIADSLKGRFRGASNPQWKGGHRHERTQWFSRFEYKGWRNAVYERDNYTCQMCGKPSNGDIQAHHIYPWSTHPELRFDTNNGITLCEVCHLSIKGKEMEYADQFTAIIQSTLQTRTPAP